MSGAPLSGKSSLCKRIQQQLKIREHQIPIITIDTLMGSSEVEAKYIKLKEEQEAEFAATGGKGKPAPKKGDPPPVDYSNYKELPEYIEEVSQELIVKL